MSQDDQLSNRKRPYSTSPKNANMKSRSPTSPMYKYQQYQTAGSLDVYTWLQKSASAWPFSGYSSPGSKGDLQHLTISPSVYSPDPTSPGIHSKTPTRLRDQISLHHILAHTEADKVTFEDLIGLATTNIDKDRPAMSTVIANQAIAAHTEFKRTGGYQFILKFLYIEIIESIGDKWDSTGLKPVFDEPLIPSSLPERLQSSIKMQKPNLTFGLCLSQFNEDHQKVISNYASQFLVSPSAVSAFLLMIHNDPPASIIDSDIQAARNATALLCSQRQLSILSNCLFDSENVDQLSWVFSLTSTTSEARLNFHFIETGRAEPYYHMHCLRKYALESSDDAKLLQRHLWNVLDYGVQYRRYHVLETLELLDEKAEGWS